MKLVGQRVREEREKKENSVTIMSTTKKAKVFRQLKSK